MCLVWIYRSPKILISDPSLCSLLMRAPSNHQSKYEVYNNVRSENRRFIFLVNYGINLASQFFKYCYVHAHMTGFMSKSTHDIYCACVMSTDNDITVHKYWKWNDQIKMKNVTFSCLGRVPWWMLSPRQRVCSQIRTLCTDSRDEASTSKQCTGKHSSTLLILVSCSIAHQKLPISCSSCAYDYE